MSSGVSFTNTMLVSGMIYLAISWGDLEDHNSLETSIILTSKAPENLIKPDGGLEYYHEWKAINLSTTTSTSTTAADWDLLTEAGWLGQKTKLALILELGRIGHTDPYPLLDNLICGAPDGNGGGGGEPDDNNGGADVHSFAEHFMMSMVTLSEDPEMRVTISEIGKQTLREQAAETISFAEVLVKDIRIANEMDTATQQSGPILDTHFMVLRIPDETDPDPDPDSYCGDCDRL